MVEPPLLTQRERKVMEKDEVLRRDGDRWSGAVRGLFVTECHKHMVGCGCHRCLGELHMELSNSVDCRDLIPVSQIAVIAVIITAIWATLGAIWSLSQTVHISL